MLRAWCPHRGPYQHGGPWLNRVRVPTVPRRHSYCAHLRLPVSISRGSGSPRPRPTTSTDASSEPATHAPVYAWRVGAWGPVPRLTGSNSWRHRASQVTGTSLLRVPRTITPPVPPPPRPPATVVLVLPSSQGGTLGSRNDPFEAYIPWPTPLRIYASPWLLLATAQDLATHLPGSALVGGDFHPLDDIPHFTEAHPSAPYGPALPGRNHLLNIALWVGSTLCRSSASNLPRRRGLHQSGPANSPLGTRRQPMECPTLFRCFCQRYNRW